MAFRIGSSLGVFNFSQRIIARLLERHANHPEVKSALNQGKQQVKIAALLHDVGHGPFSHASEHVFDTGKQHEAVSQRIIRSTESGVNEVLSRFLGESKIKEVEGLLQGHEYPFLHDIVSSQLDADRMDYLLRDSHHSGTRYGQYDADWLIHSFCLGYQANPGSDQRVTALRLCLDEKRGPHAAEQLIMARLHMSLQVYYHQNTRNLEAHLKCLLIEAARLSAESGLPALTHPSVREFLEKRGNVGHATFLQLDDTTLWAHFSYWSGCKGDASFQELARWCDALLFRKKILKSVTLEATWTDAATVTLLKEAFREKAGEENRDWLIDAGKITPYKAPLVAKQSDDPEGYYEDISESAILLSNGRLSESSMPLQHSSEILAALGRHSTPVVRVYFKETVAEAVQDIIDRYSGNVK